MSANIAPDVRARLSQAATEFLNTEITGCLIDGELVAGEGEETFEVIDPGTKIPATKITAASPAQVARAVAAARAAFDDARWSKADPAVRQEHLGKLVELMIRDREVLAELESFDTGKPKDQAAEDVTESVDVLRYFAGWVDKIEGSVPATPRRYFSATLREPLGVCAAITPWNYPLTLLMYKLAPALAFGNSFVAKPSEIASLSSIYLARLILEAGIPDGVVNLVAGGAATGSALSTDPRVDKLAFTGSTRTGRAIMHAAAENLSRVSLELGGKSAHIVFPDADMEAAVSAVMGGIWTNAGQLCVAGSRLLVHADIAEDFVAALNRHTSMLTLGHGLDPRTHIGPLVSQVQHERVESLLAEALEQGATATYGADVSGLQGYFMSPAILTDVDENSTIAHTEVFGPVLAVLTFKDENDAVRIANSTSYGLAAGIWTRDNARIHRMSRRLRAGTVWVNTYAIFHPTVPFGGFGSSGMGRELGAAAVSHYTEMKSVIMDIGE